MSASKPGLGVHCADVGRVGVASFSSTNVYEKSSKVSGISCELLRVLSSPPRSTDRRGVKGCSGKRGRWPASSGEFPRRAHCVGGFFFLGPP